MAHVFEDRPDARQSEDPALQTSRFRPRYRGLTNEERVLHDAIKAKAEELEALIMKTPSSRPRSLAITELEVAIMWAIKGLTA